MEWTDEQIAANPRTIRAIIREMTRVADDWYQAMLATHEVSDEHIDDFVRMRTLPGWRRLMDESGKEWDAKAGRWVDRTPPEAKSP